MNRRNFLLSAATIATSTRADTSSPSPSSPSTANRTFIFVHGAMHGAWCWYKVLPRVRAAGVHAIAIDLPGRGRNPAPRTEHTRASFLDSVLAALDAAPRPVTLIGHDIGGLLISLAAEAAPERIERLIYVAAYVPRDGDSLLALAQRDEESQLRGHTVISRDRASASVREDALRAVLYTDCGEENVSLAQLSLVPEATQPFTAPLQLSAERYGRVRKSAIVCTQDRALGPRLQRAMSEAAGCERVLALDCGHAPFFALPGELAAALLQA